MACYEPLSKTTASDLDEPRLLNLGSIWALALNWAFGGWVDPQAQNWPISIKVQIEVSVSKPWVFSCVMW